MKPKPPKCKVCKQPTRAFNSVMAFCGIPCQLEWLKTKQGKQTTEKVSRAAFKERKKLAKGLHYWRGKTQQSVNKYVRTRDLGLPCISCGIHPHELKDSIRGKFHAGHFKSVGAHPELRFNTFNIHNQCAKCNTWQSGNINCYEFGVIARYGQKRLDYLEGPHPIKKYTIEDLERIRRIFNKKTRLLEKKRDLL